MTINPNFYLKNPKEEETLIYMGIRLKDGWFKYYTGQKVRPELFDKQSKRAVISKAALREYKQFIPNLHIQHQNINSHLSNLEDDVRKAMSELLRDVKTIKAKDLKTKLDSIYRVKADKKPTNSFLKHLSEFIAKCESGQKLHKGKKYGYGTIKTYKTFRTLITEYDSRLTFDDIDMDFYKSFVNFLNRKNYRLNSVGKQIKFIKVIMKDALEAGLHNNVVSTYKSFEIPQEKSVEVYLSQSELNALYELKGLKSNYAIARDLFLVGCYTALRYSDYSRINENHIKTDGKNYTLDMITQKTNTRVVIPLKPLVVEILRKYSFRPIHMYEQKLNKHIKQCCKLAKINTKIELTSTVGGQVKTSYKAKFDLVKTHTARRTGATLLYLAGVPPIDICKITGHTQISNLLKYIRVTQEETANRLAENPFFK